ncbi:hypothetical protein CFP65_5727 [Kitasatospora sp. MMS16-BH015]|uniref:type I polyketide synthase n=1 Tax=Kitasatospora sp. MMS16-BH015 TaxID=2018025 RepID=UPI000CA21527|nr:type I polyketide synthase [Kitasatospora sp. MMS16-BH015]AUG80419.1 hypothetical protein CFP65_5727 [Kitasatospora sp. MMS16-BH015]
MSMEHIAVVGLALRVPGADNYAEFWRNLVAGTESISRLDDDDVLAVHGDPAVIGNSDLVKAGGILDRIDLFDPGYFGFTDREAELMDPQQRLLLQTAVEAIEDSGHRLGGERSAVGVFMGVGRSGYAMHHLMPRADLLASFARQISLFNDKDYAATQVSHRLGLTGPSMTLSTACSTSLVAVHQACVSLLGFECDTALAGGSSINVLQNGGYLYQEGNIFSPDGHCRAFDAEAGGTVGGSGVGVVVLKRLSDALRDGDPIRAVIRGSAVNNDGSDKVGFTAPSISGQAAVIFEAQQTAGVEAGSIGYVEAHGTATALGDPIEVAALTEAFRETTTETGFCALGSVKTNIGHLDTASGIAGFIKAVLCVERGLIPPSLHYRTPNPRIDFAHSPFYVNAELNEWSGPTPRRAGVSSFGLGGTNCHIILEQPPTTEQTDRHTDDHTPRHQVILASAKTTRSLDQARTRWEQFLTDTDPTNLPDIAYTSQLGRTAYEHRTATTTDSTGTTDWITGRARPDTTVAFVYGGGGTQWPGMGRHLHTQDTVFRDVMQHCAQLARDHIDLDLCDLLYGPDSDTPHAAALLEQTRIQQPALFAVQTAMTAQWRAWGIHPTAMLGHSLGEIVAATTAGVWTLPDAMRLVCWRGELMQQQAPGAMLAADVSEAEAIKLIAELSDPSAAPRCVVAAVNGPRRTILTGHADAVDAVAAALTARAIRCRRLTISHAGHSPMMDPMLGEFERRLRTLEFQAPQLPIVSTVTGEWLSAEQATDPAYWAGQVRSTVRFSEAVQRMLLDRPEALLLEVGPGATAQLLLGELEAGTDRIALSSMGNGRTYTDDSRTTRDALAHLWVNGVTVDWAALHQGRAPRRTPIPTYAFDTKRYWVEREVVDATTTATRFYTAAFRPAALPAPRAEAAAQQWLVFTNGGKTAAAWAPALAGLGELVTTVEVGETFAETGSRSFTVSPDEPADFDLLVQAVEKHTPSATWNVLYLWTTDTGADLAQAKTFALHAPVHLARALGLRRPTTPTRLALVVEGLARTSEAPIASPVGGIALGAAKTLPLEYPALTAGVLDLTASAEGFAALAAEFDAGLPDSFVAHRHGERLVERLVPVTPEAGAEPARPLRERGVYLITGGLGGIGALIATRLAEKFKARLVLTGRTVIPAREHWTAIEADPAGDPAVRRAVTTVRALEAAGAEVHLESFDVSDRPALRSAVERAEERFGPVHGVVHAAGLVGGKLAQFLRSEDMSGVLAPKVDGTLALAEVFRHHELDLFAVFSSSAALLGSVGQADYCAANAFLDAWAESAEAPASAIAIGWDAWRDLGMTAPERRSPAVAELEEQDGRVKLTAASGLAAFERAIQDGRRRLIVSDHGLPDRFARRAGGADQAAAEDRSARPIRRSRAETEEILLAVWQDLLGRSGIEREANFFELGADSLLMIAASRQIKQRLEVALTVTDLFKYSTVAALAEHLAPSSTEAGPAAATGPGGTAAGVADETAVAVIGMAARLPGADSVEAFWTNLVDGVESITPTSVPAGQAAFGNRKYVAAAGAPDGVDLFDAALFRLTPREAELMDPQQRMLLMCSHEALEDAGYDAQRHDGRVAVYVGTGTSSYLLNNLLPHQGSPTFDLAYAGMGNDKDFAASQISYRLNLQGPSVSVSTACSTALVAVAHACRSLLAGEADLAVSGGAHVRTPERSGYWHQPGGMTSPDGHCRAFDAEAAGTVFTSGVGIVVLKRLSDALRDGDPIRAVIRGSAVNNDGSDKAGFTAPSISGQAAVIREAQQTAGVEAGSIGYVEAHGTATALGDPIEVAALTEAFRETTTETGFCALGSVKTNVGHLSHAAGIAGFIKAVLCVERGLIPPSLHYRTPNPRIDFAHSPFYVNAELNEWSGPTPRRAGVSSFGLGGTNCHIILEQPPTTEQTDQHTDDHTPRHHVILASAKTTRSLDQARTRWEQFLTDTDPTNLPDIAYTSQLGRTAYEHRTATTTDSTGTTDWITGRARPDTTVAFVYGGGGTQWPGMGRHLHTQDTVFRDVMQHCAQLARDHIDLDLCDLLYGPDSDTPHAAALLEQTRIQQPALFAVQTAMTAQWRAWGIHPTAMLGHSLGEIVAATTAGVWTLPDAMRLVCRRGELMQRPESEAVRAEFEQLVGALELRAPQLPVLSTATGEWLSAEQATDPAHWAGQLRSTVPLSEAAQRMLLDRPEALLLEVGPDPTDDSRATRDALARLWVNGVTVDWAALHQGRTPRRTPIPSYAFDTKRYWIDAPVSPTTSSR